MTKIDLTYIKLFEKCTRNNQTEQLRKFVYDLSKLEVTLKNFLKWMEGGMG